MMDYIKLKNMAFFGYHGDEPEEKTLGQRFYIDVVIGTDLSKVSRTARPKEAPISFWKNWQA